VAALLAASGVSSDVGIAPLDRPKMQGRMQLVLKTSLALLAFFAVLSLPQAAAASEKRVALVIGNASYKAKALATPVNDAALVAQTLQAAGFDVMGARDLDGDLLRQTFRDFAVKVANAGPDAVAVVYFAGYGLQFEGENYLVPIDAETSETSDPHVWALPLYDQMHALAELHLKEAFIILDMARAGPFVVPDRAGGLAWAEPEANMLIAFNAAPGTVAPDAGRQSYGPYAKALAEMIRQGDLTAASLFDRVRLRVHELTGGAQVPWDASKIETQFKFFERTADAPLRADSPDHTSWMRFEPMRRIGPHDAYMVALMRDTLDAYADFLADYWHDPMTRRVQALSAARREAITWRRTYQANLPEAYWSYLERYPRGPHVADAGGLLERLGAATVPPSNFVRTDFDVPSPSPDELEYIERSVLVLDDPTFRFEQPEPPPVYFLAPLQPEFLDLMPPRGASSQPHLLPTPSPLALPAYVRVPADAAGPNAQLVHGAPENLDVKSANDSKTYNDARNASSSISSPDEADNADRAGGVRLAPSAPAKGSLLDSQNSPQPATNSGEQIKGSSDPSLKTATLRPLRLTEKEVPVRSGTEPLASTVEIEAPIPTTLAPPFTGEPFGAWSNSDVLWWREIGGPRPMPRLRSIGALSGDWTNDMLMWRATGPLPRSVTAVPTDSPPRPAELSMPSPETTGSIPSATGTRALQSSGRVMLEAWNSEMLLWRPNGRGLLPVARSRTGLQPLAPGSAMPSSQMAGSVTASIPQSVTLPPPSPDVRAWNSDTLLWRANGGARSLTLRRSHAGLSPHPPGTMPSPQRTSGIHASISRPGTPPPRSSQPKPNTEAASTSSR
jgi:uncharacterized caspase-like protein